MNLVKNIISVFLIFLPLTSCADTKVHQVKGRYSDYYHINYILNNNNFKFSNDEMGKDYKDYSEKNLTDAGGQFELLIPVNLFPIKSTNCKTSIILRMPWSDNSSNIKNKYNLFRKLQKLTPKTNEEINIVIELNPYVKKPDAAKNNITLTGCNVFFRTSKGKYIDYVGEVK